MNAVTTSVSRTRKSVSIRPSEKDGSSAGFFMSAFRKFLHSTSPRSLAILSARYGANGKDPQTLEEIGQTYGITRERVRQIISVLLESVRAKRHPQVLEDVSKKIEWTLKRHSGILGREEFFSRIAGTDARERGSIRFFLAVLTDRFREIETESIASSVAIFSFDEAVWRTVNDRAKRILVDNGSSMPEAEFIRQLEKDSALASFDRETLFDFLAVSEECRRNPFKEWGLPEWSDICPRGTRDRAFIVLRAEKKPLHFREIAEKIDRSGLQKPGKTTHPQTVHNELIKDKRFVLVGRGTYALVEWGYRRGTVREVIEHILLEQRHSLSREEIVSEVLKVRDVKEATIAINLNSFFNRNKSGKYELK